MTKIIPVTIVKNKVASVRKSLESIRRINQKFILILDRAHEISDMEEELNTVLSESGRISLPESVEKSVQQFISEICSGEIEVEEAKDMCSGVKLEIAFLATLPLRNLADILDLNQNSYKVDHGNEIAWRSTMLLSEIVALKDWVQVIIDLLYYNETHGCAMKGCGDVLKHMPNVKLLSPLEKTVRSVVRQMATEEIDYGTGSEELDNLYYYLLEILDGTF